MVWVILGLLVINAWLLFGVAKYYISWKSEHIRVAEYQTKYYNVLEELDILKAQVPSRDDRGRFTKKN